MDNPKVQTEPQGSENAAPVTIVQKLAQIQKALKAPKSQYNSFSSYYYRNCEDILEALKPLLGPDYVIMIEDQIVQVGERYYVKATALITNGKDRVESSAYARESLDKKGMDDSQITGATSSYARKYALNGLLAIDDAKDADSNDNRPAKQPAKPQGQNPAQPTRPPGPPPQNPQAPKTYPASDKQLKYMATLCTETGIDREKLKEEYKVKSAKELTSAQASQIINTLMQMPKLPKPAPKAETPPTAPTVGSPEAGQQPNPAGQKPPKTAEAMTVAEIMNSKMTPEEKAAAMQKRIGVHVTTAAQLPAKQ